MDPLFAYASVLVNVLLAYVFVLRPYLRVPVASWTSPAVGTARPCVRPRTHYGTVPYFVEPVVPVDVHDDDDDDAIYWQPQGRECREARLRGKGWTRVAMVLDAHAPARLTDRTACGCGWTSKPGSERQTAYWHVLHVQHASV